MAGFWLVPRGISQGDSSGTSIFFLMSDIEWPEIEAGREPILKIRPDGRLELRDHVSVDEASKALWDDIRKRFSLRVNLLEEVVEKARTVTEDPSERNLRDLRHSIERLHLSL